MGVVVFVVVDFVWLGTVANGFYRRELGALLRQHEGALNPRLAPAALLYLLMALGLLVFALPRGGGSLVAVVAWSALFGVIGYGVYDLTNYSTMEGFPLAVTVVDMAWGGVLCGLTGAAMHLARA